jgi:hypothetical protein
MASAAVGKGVVNNRAKEQPKSNLTRRALIGVIA